MKNIIKTLQEINELTKNKTYIVGGYIRDLLMSKTTYDLDISVKKSAGKFAKMTAGRLNGKYIVLDGDRKTYRVIVFNNPQIKCIDVSLIRGKTIREDLSKRDFSVNALAADINDFGNIKKSIIDVSSGIKDIKSKVINIVSKTAFKEDPLRMLRAFRFAGSLNFKLSKNTINYIKKYSKLIISSAPERIKNELFIILNSKRAADLIVQTDDCKLLESIFPVITAMKKSAKKFYYHPKGLFQHCLQTLSSLERILNKLNLYFKNDTEKLSEHLNCNFSENVNKLNLLKFIALFHDCAKPECAKKINNTMRFLGHEEEGAKKVKDIMKTLKMGNKETDYVIKMITNHMRPSSLTKVDIITIRAKMRFFRDLAENTPDILILALADWHSYKSLKIYPKKTLKHQEELVSELVSDYFKFKEQTKQEKIIDGNILMKKLSLKPGKIVGELLKIIEINRQEGKISSQNDAIKFAKSKLTLLQKRYKM